MGPVLVFGHRNPDNDSICSAVAYAHLKNLTDSNRVYLPARLGPVPAETAWAFERFGVKLPQKIEHVHTRVRDVMTESVITVGPDRSMLEAGRLMRENHIRALPVVDGRGVAIGLASQRVLAELYLEATELGGFGKMPVSVGRLARVLEGELLAGDATASVSGDVLIAAAEPDTLRERIQPGDVLIVGDRVRTQPMAIEAGVACLVVTSGSTPVAEVVELARSSGTALIATRHDTFAAARLVALAHAVGDVMDTDVLLVEPDMLLSEAAEELLSSLHREAVVVDSHGVVCGILTRTNVAMGIRRQVVLVDHNETSQSAMGIEEADVVEIVDHHRVGDIETSGPILFLNLPVGSTATIVANRYVQLGIEIPEAMAGILLAALLTDTVVLKSPTTTDLDRTTCEQLAQLAKLDAREFGMELFRSKSAGQEFSAGAIVRTDLKEYRSGDTVTAIAQYETVDLAGVLEHRVEILAEMANLRESRGYDLVVLMATDIVREGTEILAAGKTRIVERGLGVTLADGSAWMPGVLSRKKQVAAPIVLAAGS